MRLHSRAEPREVLLRAKRAGCIPCDIESERELGQFGSVLSKSDTTPPTDVRPMGPCEMHSQRRRADPAEASPERFHSAIRNIVVRFAQESEKYQPHSTFSCRSVAPWKCVKRARKAAPRRSNRFFNGAGERVSNDHRLVILHYRCRRLSSGIDIFSPVSRHFLDGC